MYDDISDHIFLPKSTFLQLAESITYQQAADASFGKLCSHLDQAMNYFKSNRIKIMNAIRLCELDESKPSSALSKLRKHISSTKDDQWKVRASSLSNKFRTCSREANRLKPLLQFYGQDDLQYDSLDSKELLYSYMDKVRAYNTTDGFKVPEQDIAATTTRDDSPIKASLCNAFLLLIGKDLFQAIKAAKKLEDLPSLSSINELLKQQGEPVQEEGAAALGADTMAAMWRIGSFQGLRDQLKKGKALVLKPEQRKAIVAKLAAAGKKPTMANIKAIIEQSGASAAPPESEFGPSAPDPPSTSSNVRRRPGNLGKISDGKRVLVGASASGRIRLHIRQPNDMQTSTYINEILDAIDQSYSNIEDRRGFVWSLFHNMGAPLNPTQLQNQGLGGQNPLRFPDEIQDLINALSRNFNWRNAARFPARNGNAQQVWDAVRNFVDDVWQRQTPQNMAALAGPAPANRNYEYLHDDAAEDEYQDMANMGVDFENDEDDSQDDDEESDEESDSPPEVMDIDDDELDEESDFPPEVIDVDEEESDEDEESDFPPEVIDEDEEDLPAKQTGKRREREDDDEGPLNPATYEPLLMNERPPRKNGHYSMPGKRRNEIRKLPLVKSWYDMPSRDTKPVGQKGGFVAPSNMNPDMPIPRARPPSPQPPPPKTGKSKDDAFDVDEEDEEDK